MKEEKIIKILSEIYKRQIIFELESKKEKTEYDLGLIFALKQDIYPMLDEDHDIINLEILRVIEDSFSIKRALLEDFYKQIDLSYKNHDYKNFYEWEDILGKDNRDEIILFFEYCFIEKRFNDEFKKKLIDHEHNPEKANYLLQYLEENKS